MLLSAQPPPMRSTREAPSLARDARSQKHFEVLRKSNQSHKHKPLHHLHYHLRNKPFSSIPSITSLKPQIWYIPTSPNSPFPSTERRSIHHHPSQQPARSAPPFHHPHPHSPLTSERKKNLANALPQSTALKSIKSLAPLLDRVLVQRIKAQTQTAGGIFLPESSVKELNEARVLAVGPGGLDKEGKTVKPSVQAGDRVLIPQVCLDMKSQCEGGVGGKMGRNGGWEG